MVSIDAVLDYIETHYKNVLHRPHMYARSAVALEDLLIELDKVREYILTGKKSAGSHGFSDFLEHEYKLRSAIGYYCFTIKHLTESEQFHQFAAVWKKYINSKYFLPR